MKASLENPKYSAYVVSGDKRLNLTSVVTNLERTQNDGEIAQRVNIEVANIKHDGSYLSSIIAVRDRIYIYADTGDGPVEVFRGYVWERPYISSTEKTLKITAYDNLIYLQKSDDCLYFSAGKSTEAICSQICEEWGIKLNYKYWSITHPKLPLRGNLADIFMDDLLNAVKKQTGYKWVLYSEKDEMYIAYVGKNETVYTLRARNNAIEARSSVTMDGMVTRVKIMGKADEDERQPVEDTVSGDTAKYGTLQKTINRSEGTSLADAKAEAQETIKEKGTPIKEWETTAVDIPWVKKGDKVKIDAGDMSNKEFIVKSITHDAKKKEMTVEMFED